MRIDITSFNYPLKKQEIIDCSEDKSMSFIKLLTLYDGFKQLYAKEPAIFLVNQEQLKQLFPSYQKGLGIKIKLNGVIYTCMEWRAIPLVDAEGFIWPKE